MKKLLALAFLLLATPAAAQNPTCPTRPLGDSTNACASTAFVQQNAGGAANIAAYSVLGNPTSASASGISTRMGFLHSKDVGAIGNGIANDTAALQSWINQCQTNLLVCYLDAGTYLISAELSITATIKITGASRYFSGGSRIQLGSTTQNGFNINNMTSSQAGEIGDIVILGAAGATAGSAIVCTGSNPAIPITLWRFRNLLINAAFIGIQATNCSNFWVGDNYINAVATGTVLKINAVTGDSIIVNNQLTGVHSGSGTIIAIDSSAGLRIMNNKIQQGTLGISWTGAVGFNDGDLLITGNSIEAQATSGIKIVKGSATGFGNITITGNEFGNITTLAIDLSDTTAGWLNSIAITGNTIGNSTTGISVGGANGFSISGNSFYLATTAITIGANASNGSIGPQSYNTVTTQVSNSSTSVSEISTNGSTSGAIQVRPQAVAGNPALVWPNSSGTLVASASTPLVASATTGNLTCPTCTTSAGALTANQLVIGSGSQGMQSLGTLGTTTTLLHGNAAGAPTFGAVVSADLSITTTACTNQFVTAISAGAVGTCTTALLGSAQFANQGTTTTVLHGNAAGNPGFSAVVTADITDANITYAKIQNVTALSVFGRASNSSGIGADITAATDFNILRRSGTAIGFGSIDLSQSGAVGASVLAGVNGGTGLSTAAIGDLIYASATTPTWARLADVATGSLLASGGVGVAPAYCAACTLTTSLTTPLHVGGTAVGSSLTLQSTSGVGTTDSIKFLTGNNGATEGMRVQHSGQIAMGTTVTAADAILTINQNTTLPAALIGTPTFHMIGADAGIPGITMDGIANAPSIYLRRADNTLASPSATQNNESLGVIGFAGYGATAWTANFRAGIVATAAENWSDTVQGGKMDFWTAATGGTTINAKIRIQASGGLTVGNSILTTDPGAGTVNASAMLITGVVAVASLPACGASTKGARHFVTDSNAASFTAGIGAIVAAGGSTNVPVTCDGTNWRIG